MDDEVFKISIPYLRKLEKLLNFFLQMEEVKDILRSALNRLDNMPRTSTQASVISAAPTQTTSFWLRVEAFLLLVVFQTKSMRLQQGLTHDQYSNTDNPVQSSSSNNYSLIRFL